MSRCHRCDVPLRFANSAKQTADTCQRCYDEMAEDSAAERVRVLRRLIFLLCLKGRVQRFLGRVPMAWDKFRLDGVIYRGITYLSAKVEERR